MMHRANAYPPDDLLWRVIALERILEAFATSDFGALATVAEDYQGWVDDALARTSKLKAENEKLKATIKDLREYIALGEPEQ